MYVWHSVAGVGHHASIGPWAPTSAASPVPFAAFDASGRLVIAAQESYGEAVTLGIRPAGGSLTWTTVTAVGDLSGLAIGPDGRPLVAFGRITKPGAVSRIWLAHSPS